MYPIPPPDPYLPTIPPPPPQKRTIWRWYRNHHPLVQISLGCSTLIATLLIGSICVFYTAATVQGIRLGAQYTVATQTARAQAVSGRTRIPRMGGSLDDFVSQYGLPTKTAPDNELFTATNKVQITAYVNKSQTVNQVFVKGLSTWTWVDTQSYCSQFLPDGASETSSAVGDRLWINYHSSMGEITMQLQTPTCVLFVVSS